MQPVQVSRAHCHQPAPSPNRPPTAISFHSSQAASLDKLEFPGGGHPKDINQHPLVVAQLVNDDLVDIDHIVKVISNILHSPGQDIGHA